MHFSVARVSFYIPSAQSIKDKRRVIKSIINRLKNRNISIAETGRQDSWRNAEISFAIISNSKDMLEKQMKQTVDFIEDNYPVEIIEVEYTLE